MGQKGSGGWAKATRQLNRLAEQVMKPRQLLLKLAVCGGLLTAVNPALAQTWTLAGAPITNWVALASSADGTRLAAAATSASYWAGAGPIFTSTNSGQTWTQTSAPVTNWNCLASSADGTVLVAADYRYGFWVSTNSGLAWAAAAAPPFPANDVRVTISADGAKIVACAWAPFQMRYLIISTNSGGTWATTNYIGYYLRCVASSADGTTLVVGNSPYGILTSTNSGTTWADNYTPFSAAILACSADGSKLAAGAFGGGTWVSADAAVTWTYTGLDGIFTASSVDGMKMIAGYNGIFTSTNFGATWITNDVPALSWYAVASSADGNRLFAAANGGGIYTCRITPTPVLNVTPSGNELLLSWIIPSQDFVLQQGDDLASSNWTDVTNAPVLNLTNLQNQVVIPLSSSNQFFRLKSL